MKRRCRTLRERALQAGAESPELAHWRIHARSCPECQTELYLVETLWRQSETQRQHLGRREVAELFAAARACRQNSKGSGLLRGVLGAAASLCLLLATSWHLTRVDRVRSIAESGSVHLLGLVADAAGGNYAIPLQPASPEHEQVMRQVAAGSSGTPMPLPAALPGFLLRERLMGIREDLEFRRQELLDLQEQDLRDWGRDDAWHAVQPANLAAA